MLPNISKLIIKDGNLDFQDLEKNTTGVDPRTLTNCSPTPLPDEWICSRSCAPMPEALY